ncbi:lysophospholipid acyltransferase family protein [Crossiella sp. CA-258035]|uniref:lysophospholipid acyltransferase family protein n=1 Tax=Crossiella sp. CA-258035 TaxID=2981138 RepID=UPI0024BC0FA3|nr:lysophospholipid acyltransferase family protein [Crossiella sp. CA-258035]WHT21853.1 lysophospholipid acyltransferase family protein [Crossiella sp. CA-258035]
MTEHPSGLPEGAWPWFNDLCRGIGTVVARTPYRLHLHHRERIPRTGAVVMVANHTAFLDGPVLFCVLGRRSVFLVKHEQFQGPLGKFLRRLGQLPVRRGAPDRTPLLTAVRLLREGEGLVGVFPEGTRGTGEVVKAANGAAWLARSGGALVLPVACRGFRRPEGSGRRFRPRVDVLFGTPFALPPGKGKTALTEATELVRGRLAELVAELDVMRAGYPGNAEQQEGDSA